MQKYILTILFMLCMTFSNGQKYNETYGKPIIVLIETDPWLMVFGSDVPTFALYENGQIIYRKIMNKRYKYFEIRNDSITTQKIIKSLGISDSLMKLPNNIQALWATDQPTNILLLNFDTIKEISVYGNLRNKNNEARTHTPGDFLTLYDNIIRFNDHSANE